MGPWTQPLCSIPKRLGPLVTKMEVLRSIPQRLGPLVTKNGNFCGAFRRGWVHRKAKRRLKRNCDCADPVCIQSVCVSSFLRFDTGLEEECSLEHG